MSCEYCGRSDRHDDSCQLTQKPNAAKLYLVGGTHQMRMDAAEGRGVAIWAQQVREIGDHEQIRGLRFTPEDELVVVGQVDAALDRELAMICMLTPPKGWA